MGCEQAFTLETHGAHARRAGDDDRPQAQLMMTSAQGAFEMELAGRRCAGVLFVRPAPVGVGDVLGLKVLCSVDSEPYHAFSDPQELQVEVLAVDDVTSAGHRQTVAPGVALTVAFESAERELLPLVIGIPDDADELLDERAAVAEAARQLLALFAQADVRGEVRG